MLYHDLHRAVDRLDGIQAPLRRAILATTTQEMADRMEEAQAAARELIDRLQRNLQDNAGTFESETAGGKAERLFAQAAVDALQQAIVQTEAALGAADVLTFRSGLLDVMSQADYANVYLRAAVGDEET
jgi:hypothetical protein